MNYSVSFDTQMKGFLILEIYLNVNRVFEMNEFQGKTKKSF